jgi:beta-phosphoglucomutase-like phosphatase (HAD superfamily)
MYLKAMDFFRLNPQQCLILEDNENGIKAAQSSGAHLQVVSTVDEVHLGTVQRAIARANELNQRSGGTLGR